MVHKDPWCTVCVEVVSRSVPLDPSEDWVPQQGSELVPPKASNNWVLPSTLRSDVTRVNIIL